MIVLNKKKLIQIFITQFLLMASMGAKAEDGISLMYLEGDWMSGDYRCTSLHTEKISISIKNNQVKALKVDSGGDTCVPTNSNTFHGTLPTELSFGRPMSVVVILGSPSRPACCTGKGYLVMLDSDSFNICSDRTCNSGGADWVMRFSRTGVTPGL